MDFFQNFGISKHTGRSRFACDIPCYWQGALDCPQRSLGCRVSRQIGISGFGNARTSRICEPPYHHYAQPPFEMGIWLQNGLGRKINTGSDEHAQNLRKNHPTLPLVMPREHLIMDKIPIITILIVQKRKLHQEPWQTLKTICWGANAELKLNELLKRDKVQNKTLWYNFSKITNR